MRTPSGKGGKNMRTLSVFSLVLALWAQAQTAPEISLPPGDATRGKAIFSSSKANCQSCHRIQGTGSLFGPDLSTIGAPPRGGGAGGGAGRGGAAAPAANAANAAPARGAAAPAFGGDEVANARIGAAPALTATPTAAAANDTMMRQLAQSILDPNAVMSVQNRYVLLTMKDGKKISGKLLSVDTFYIQIFDSNEKLANISKDTVREMTMTSPMPSYRDKLTTQELADVISYLMSLKGQ
jgi:mono/diheme cytochrome c family protein